MTVEGKLIEVYAAATERNTFLGATNTSPYFCFEAQDEKELKAIVTRAFKFYARHAGAPSPVKSGQVSVTEFIPTRVIDRRRLAVA